MVFANELERINPPPGVERTWFFVPYDQLSDAYGPWTRLDPSATGMVFVECSEKACRRPYHKQKLALILSNQRHFALEQARRGVSVRYLVAEGDYASALGTEGPLRMMRAAERELRAELQKLENLEVVDHEGWLTTTDQFQSACGEPPWRMDAFYRRVRRDSGLLMEAGKPVGGKFSFDAENRKRWPGTPPAPDVPRFEADPIVAEVGELIESQFGAHPGRLDLAALPATKDDAHRLWRWALEECMEHFGPFEDAMSRHARSLFHTRISALLNIGRLSAREVIDDVLALDIPLSSKEGFLRQVIGWREFVRHVHEATDGFRTCESNYFGVAESLPPAFWPGSPSGLACLDDVVDQVWDEGYSHHITRLMVLSNIATLLDVSPRELTDWFWVAYTDAFDWVVEPNVLGMGTFGTGDLMTTKPYVCGAAYIDKMSDFCGACSFHPKKNCPITRMYWAFLGRHEAKLAGNQRMSLILASLRRRSAEKRDEDQAIASRVRQALTRGVSLTTGS